MRILFLSRWYPYPADNGSKIRIANLLAGICRQHDVSLLSFRDPLADAQPFGGPRDIRTCEFQEFNPASARARAGFLSRTPRSFIDTYRPEMELLIRQAVREERYDLVIASQWSMANYRRAFHGIPAVLEEAELAMFQPTLDDGMFSPSGLRQRLTWAKQRWFVGDTLPHFRLCTVASEPERALIQPVAPPNVRVQVVPNFIDTRRYVPSGGARPGNSIVFTGSMRYGPNHDAVTWFVENILPAIPGVSFTVTGDPGTGPLPRAEGVHYAGRVDDVCAVVGNATVSVVPIRQGGGTRLKILEAMALGTPLVTTSKGVEGIDARHGEHVLIANTPLEFADAVKRLMSNPEFARGLAGAARRLVVSQYDALRVVPFFNRLLDEAAAPVAQAVCA